MTSTVTGIVLTLSASPAISLVAKATVVVAFGLIGAWLSRRSRAAVRHALLASTFSVLLALPIVSFLATPVPIAVPVAKTNSNILPLFDDLAVTSSGAPAPGRLNATTAKSRWPQVLFSTISPATMLLGGWLLGTAFFVFPIVRGALQIHSLRRFGVLWRHEHMIAPYGVEVLLHESLPGPITCGLLNPVIILPADAQTWDRQDLERALVHELEHVRRHDWAIHCLARIACAAYWFHPLVWIASRQLALEAERSCDDAVLKSSEATTYADQLVALARRRSAAKRSPALAMAGRSDLAARISALLDRSQRRGPVGALLVAAACIVAAAIVVTMSPLRMVAAPQGDASVAAENIPKWDAVSVKPCTTPPVGGQARPGANQSSDRITLRCQSLLGLVFGAYTVYKGGHYNGQVAGAVRYDDFPEWTRSERYTIEAKAVGTPGQPMMLGPMMQTLLEDRFRLKVHTETREGPAYFLSVAKGGPKMQTLEPGGCAPVDLSNMETPPNPCPTDGHYQPPNFTWDVWTNMDSLTRYLTVRFADPAVADMPVINNTGLAGNYHVHLEFTNPNAAAAQATDAPTGPSIFSAVEKLGLKLDSGKGPRQYLIFDHADKVPTEN